MVCPFCNADYDKPAARNCVAPLMHAATVYTNPGKGVVLTSDSVTSRLADLFNERARWTSAELNERLGWQFSQAVYALRRRGWKITTVKIGPRAYAYQREANL
jgi:hypothetical protein